MHSILLITTGENCVSDILKEIDCRLIVVDCSSFNSRLEFLQTISAVERFDIMVAFRCPYLLPSEIFNRAGITAVNIHPSLLPRYAGANPWRSMMTANETKGGVTLHHMTDRIDGGEIILQKSFDMDLTHGIEEARRKSEQIAAEILISYLESVMIFVD